MKCPLQTKKTGHYTSSSPNPTHQTIDFLTCDEECQWFDQVKKTCSVKIAAAALANIAEDLSRIADVQGTSRRH